MFHVTCDVCVTKLLLTVTRTGALAVSGAAFQPIVFAWENGERTIARLETRDR